MYNMFSLYLVLAGSIVTASTIYGPPRVVQHNVFHLGRLGEEVILSCPMEGKPPLIIEWMKGDEKIDFQWTRYRANKHILRIKDAEREDSGRFYCLGVNGFGHEKLPVDLFVIDPADFPELADGQLPDWAPPTLTPETATARDQFELKTGDTFTVSCSIPGKPRPSIVWYKNGQPLMEPLQETADDGSTSLLRLHSLREEDSGRYTCRGQNQVGDASKDYFLTVQNTLLDNPVFFSTQTNKTVREGERATFDCRVERAHRPTIKWLKKLEPADLLAADEEVITVGQYSFRLIESSGGLGGMEEVVSQLELDTVQQEDAGMYICLVTNMRGGFNLKQAFLTVLPRYETVFDSPLVLSISISLAVLTLVILCGLLCCLVRNRHRSKLPPTGSSSLPPPAGDMGEVQQTLIPQQQPPGASAVGGGVGNDSLYCEKVGQPLPPPPTPVQWSAASSSTSRSPYAQLSYTDSSSHYEPATNNTYEVPRPGIVGGGDKATAPAFGGHCPSIESGYDGCQPTAYGSQVSYANQHQHAGSGGYGGSYVQSAGALGRNSPNMPSYRLTGTTGGSASYHYGGGYR